jgi:hypothetical protein
MLVESLVLQVPGALLTCGVLGMLLLGSALPKSVESMVSFVQRRMRAWSYLYKGPSIVQRAFLEVNMSNLTWLCRAYLSHTVSWRALRGLCTRCTYGVRVVS